MKTLIPSNGGRGRKGGGGGGRRLPSLQQLQLIQVLSQIWISSDFSLDVFQVLSEYFNSDADFKLLCSVFMIVFMIQGRDIEYKVSFSPCQGESPFAGVNIGATALTSTGGKLCGHPQLWWGLGHSGNSYLYTQPQCCQPPCARLHCHSAWPLLHLETSPYPIPSIHS